MRCINGSDQLSVIREGGTSNGCEWELSFDRAQVCSAIGHPEPPPPSPTSSSSTGSGGGGGDDHCALWVPLAVVVTLSMVLLLVEMVH